VLGPELDAAADGLLAAEVEETGGSTDADGDVLGALSLMVGGVVPASPFELSAQPVTARPATSSPNPPASTRRPARDVDGVQARAHRVVGIDFLASDNARSGSVGGRPAQRRVGQPPAASASEGVSR
jgi:hypothetical protein